jgi:hypothetical protein
MEQELLLQGTATEYYYRALGGVDKAGRQYILNNRELLLKGNAAVQASVSRRTG